MFKKIFFVLSTICILNACEKVETPSQVENENDLDCVVYLNFVGDISSSESPLSKASTSANDLYAVQIYDDSSNKYFAWGIYDDPSKIKVNLKTGKKYKAVVVLVKDAKTTLGSNYSLTNGGVSVTNNSGPFNNGNVNSYYTRTNVLFYYTLGYWQYYNGSSATSLSQSPTTSYYLKNLGIGNINGISYPTVSDWLYGEVSNYVPDGTVGTMDIELKRTGFGLKYELSGVTDGTVAVTISNSDRTFYNDTISGSTYSSDSMFIAFKDVYSAWQYADNYTENLNVKVVWTRGIGITQDLGTKTVQVKRNCLNDIKIRLGSDDRGAGVSLTAEAEESMGEAENTIPVQ